MRKLRGTSLLLLFFAYLLISCVGNPRGLSTEIINSSKQPATPNSSRQQGNLACANLECWDGVFPGLTTFDEAQTLLEVKYGESNVVADRLHHAINWTSGNEIEDFQDGRLSTTEDGIVRDITVTFSKNQLTVAELISQIGAPSLVYVARAFSSDSYCAGSLISYRSKGVNAWLIPEEEFIGVSPTQNIQRLLLLSPEQVENWAITDHVVVEWQGYVDYCKLAFPEPFEGGK